ncbi:uncharacterized protein LOC110942583 [Helianthus annuus]|uniref:uncharacterized protein LOC110942583 n=1 Tax=Helianthus annuus TaxID=4232 RepID=UPI000B909BFB|nr:uncharacterized protein LOC110942583 [Helianthus annuus]
MEVLTLILQKQVLISNDFSFHSKCEKQRIINLCFADDLFLFARGDNRSAKTIMEALNMFKNMLGLVSSMVKSTVFFSNVTEEVKQCILDIMPFEEGSLPVRYLGVPLLSTRLQYKDCKQLVKRMKSRITDWKTKCLSFAEDRMKHFLWAQGDSIKGKAKVWKSVCRPKCEGGLGIRRVGDMNNALMTVHVWSVLTHRESLWVKWIHSYRLRNRSFWEIPLRGNMTWSWRKMLNLRPIIRNHIWTEVGDGADTSAWGMEVSSAWVNRFPVLANIRHIVLDAAQRDKLIWKSSSGSQVEFSTSVVWDDVRTGQNMVQWANIWNGVKDLAGMESMCNKWDSIYEHLVRVGSSKNARHVIGKLVVGATAYYVWQERNTRLFSIKKRSATRLVEIFLATVRMKLHTMRFKRTSQVERMLQDWSFPRGLVIEDDDCG